MFPNRIQYFMRNILQNSRLNRQKFVKNKEKYNNALSKSNKILINNNQHPNKYHNYIIKRNFGTYEFNLKPKNNGDGPNNPFMVLLMAVSLYFVGSIFNSE